MSTATDRAAALYAAGVASSTDGRPIVAARQLRTALRTLNGRSAESATESGVAELRGRILISLAWVEAEQGHLDLGFRLLDEAEPLIPAHLRWLLLGQRGLLLRRGGRDEVAVREYDTAIALLSEHSEPVGLVKALSNRGALYLAAGRVGLARADLRRSAQIAGRHGLTMLEALVTHNLGDLDLLAGDLPSALSTFAAVAGVYQDRAPGRLPNLAIDRARALLAAGLLGEADRELATAMEQARAQRLPYVYLDALLARAEAALLAGRPAAARAWATEARARLLRRRNARRAAVAELLALRARHAATAATAAVAGPARALATALNALGLVEDGLVAGLLAVRALVADRRVADAERELTRHRRPRSSDRLDTRLLWRLAHAELATAAGRPAEAARHLRAGMVSLQRYRSQLGCLDLQTGAAVHGRDLAAAGVSGALASGSPAEVYRWSELARAQALLLPPVRPPEDPEAVAALEELRQVRGALRDAELAEAPTGALRVRSEALQRRIREHAWSAAGPGTATRPAPMRAVMAELAEAAMVVYLRDGAALWALVAVAGSARLVPLGALAHAEEALLRLRADLDVQAGRALPSRLARAVAQATRRDAAALAADVLDPVLDLVGDRDLVVVPTGALVTVPWAVLPGCAQRPVTVAPSATTWRVARSRRADHEAGPDPARALLVAGPGTERGEAEVRAIAVTHAHATVLTGSAATPDAVLARLGDVRVAHLAAHGHHAADNPLFSALDLAGGPLMGYDLQHVDGTPAIVVLSACDLGLADVRPGDETLGMVTALLSTGSCTVVASVSRVADDTAMTVMTGYHRATGRGLSPAVALAGATESAHPASFVCFGAG
ncbi:CHAT domain-containing protein [Plantactinospora solaniradicis]|uniref:CHAT domain-containing protein n=1 Tax=Plantactinospora solaniradicis TaxID=1723736 RepID=A0ABW1KKS0_9ACTN